MLWKDVVAGLSGGIGVGLTIAAAYFQWVANNGKAALWIAAAIAFFYAGYRAWLQERRKLQALQNKYSRRDFVIEQLKNLINEYREIDTFPDLSQPVERHVHDLSKIVDHSMRLKTLVERYFDAEYLAVYRSTNHLWQQDQIRQVMDDLLLRLVDGEIDIKPANTTAVMPAPKTPLV